jgi:CubicO group peptidase (beta-lactamase class C family)
MQSPGNPGRRQFLYAGAGMLAASLPGSGKADANPYGRAIAWGEQQIRAEMAKNPNLAGMSVAMLKDDRVVWQQAYGHASALGRAPATRLTRFNIASVSKVVTALAAIILQDRGLIDLDAPVVRYLGTSFSMLSPKYRQITVRHLLSHASGLPGTNVRNVTSFDVPLAGYAADTQAAQADTHLKHLPGEMAMYCNDGFTLIESLVHAVTGRKFTAFVQDNILAPLEMANSGYRTAAATFGAIAYADFHGTRYQDIVNTYGSGGLCTTPGDMMNFARMLLAGGLFKGRRIASADGIADMGRAQTGRLTIDPCPEWRWGLGWDNVEQPGLRAAGVVAWQKGGDTAFFHSEFFVLPKARMALLITGNTGYGAIAEGVLLRALREDGTIGAFPAKVGGMVPPVAAAPDISHLAGIYGNCVFPIQAVVGPGGLRLNQYNPTADGYEWIPSPAYRYRSDGWWWSDDRPDVSYRFKTAKGPDGGETGTFHYLIERKAPGAGFAFVTQPLGQRLAPRKPLSAAWKARIGTRWRETNQSRHGQASIRTGGDLTARLTTLAELPGYVLFANPNDDGDLTHQLLVPLSAARAGMSVKLPVLLGRDLYEAVFSTVDGISRMTIGGTSYRRLFDPH